MAEAHLNGGHDGTFPKRAELEQRMPQAATGATGVCGMPVGGPSFQARLMPTPTTCRRRFESGAGASGARAITAKPPVDQLLTLFGKDREWMMAPPKPQLFTIFDLR